MRGGLWLCASALAVQSAAPVALPVATILTARLTSGVSSQTARRGDPISAVLIAPVATRTGVLSPGAVLTGTVREVTAHSFDHQATLGLDFNRLEVGGNVRPIATRVRDVDNAREKVDKNGLILGPSTQADRKWGRVELLALAVLVPEVFVVDAAGSRIREGVHVDVSYNPGVDFELQTTAPLDVTNVPFRDAAPAPALPASLRALIATLPLRASAGKPSRPADLFNVAFVGSGQQLADVFDRAGWATADSLSVRADVKTFLAVAGRAGYQNGPVSLETLDGRAPDYVFQKQNDTFAMRHHVRIWREGSWDGQPLWIGAATHDIGVKFAVRERSFTHRVDGRIDLERQKIVDDLQFIGAPAAAYEVRAAAPRSTTNATQDPISTDGRIAVLRLSGN